jgi:hypothetical protein
MTRLLLLMLLGCVRLPYVEPAPRGGADAMRTDVRVVSYCGNNTPRQGHGVVVSERHVLTVHHVVQCAYIPRVRVTFMRNGREETLRMNVIREDEGADLAKLEISSAERFHLNVPPPALFPINDTPTNEIACLGGWSGDWSQCGVVAMMPHIILYMVVKPGDSGSAVYTKGFDFEQQKSTNKDGYLIGIVTGRGEAWVDGSLEPFTVVTPIDASWL